jgi:predicted DNA-binding protein (UPF0251 family)
MSNEKKRLARIAGEMPPLLTQLCSFAQADLYNTQPIVTIKRKLRALLKQMEAMVEVPDSLREIVQLAPDGFGCLAPGYGRQYLDERHVHTQQWLHTILADATQLQRRRRRTPPTEIKPLTPKQFEAWELVGQHGGNINKAAKLAGISRTAMVKRLNQAVSKLAKHGVPKPKLKKLPKDSRGQVNIADPNALDMNAPDPSKRRR